MNRTHNFPDNITIVLKKKTNQGFIALDNKSLKTGIAWAGLHSDTNDKEKPYELLEYINGHFRLKLSKAAERSYSQGGKLSFWTLEVTAPDFRVFDIGINSDSLIETMFETTVVNGDIRGKFYLGRTDGQQSIAKKDSLYYKEYIELADIKKIPLTKNYKIGDKIINDGDEYIYVGPFMSYIEADFNDLKGDFNDLKGTNIVIILKKRITPVEKFLYAKKSWISENMFCKELLKKMGGRINGKIELESLNKLMIQIISDLKNTLIRDIRSSNNYFMYSELNNYLLYKGINEIDDAVKELKELGATEFIKILK